jgi:flagellar hook-length control protein FliK
VAAEASQQADASIGAAQRLNAIDRLFTLNTPGVGGSSRTLQTSPASQPAKVLSSPSTAQTAPVTQVPGQNAPPVGQLPTPAMLPEHSTLTTGLTTAPTTGRAVGAPSASAPSDVSTPSTSVSVTTSPVSPASQTAQSPVLTTAQSIKAASDAAVTAAQTPATDPAAPISTNPILQTGVVLTATTQAQVAKDAILPRPDGDRSAVAEPNQTASATKTSLIPSAITAPQASGAQTDADTDDARPDSSAFTEPTAAGISSVSGTSQLTEGTHGVFAAPTAGNAPLDQSQLIAQVTRHIETMRLLNGSGEVTLSLNPDQLGSLHLTITRQADGVTAHIVTETKQAQQAMEDGKEQLRASFEARGLRLTTLDVTVGQNATDAGAGFSGPPDTPQDRAEAAFARGQNPGRSGSSAGASNLGSVAPVSSRPSMGSSGTSSRLDYRA